MKAWYQLSQGGMHMYLDEETANILIGAGLNGVLNKVDGRHVHMFESKSVTITKDQAQEWRDKCYLAGSLDLDLLYQYV